MATKNKKDTIKLHLLQVTKCGVNLQVSTFIQITRN